MSRNKLIIKLRTQPLDKMMTVEDVDENPQDEKMKPSPLKLNLNQVNFAQPNEDETEKLQNSAREYQKLKKMQSILLGMNDGIGNIFKQKTKPKKANTSKDLMSLLMPKLDAGTGKGDLPSINEKSRKEDEDEMVLTDETADERTRKNSAYPQAYRASPMKKQSVDNVQFNQIKGLRTQQGTPKQQEIGAGLFFKEDGLAGVATMTTQAASRIDLISMRSTAMRSQMGKGSLSIGRRDGDQLGGWAFDTTQQGEKDQPWHIVTPQVTKNGKVIRGYQDYKGTQYENMFFFDGKYYDSNGNEISDYLIRSQPGKYNLEVKQLKRQVKERNELRTSLIKFDQESNLKKIPNSMRLSPLGIYKDIPKHSPKHNNLMIPSVTSHNRANSSMISNYTKTPIVKRSSIKLANNLSIGQQNRLIDQQLSNYKNEWSSQNKWKHYDMRPLRNSMAMPLPTEPDLYEKQNFHQNSDQYYQQNLQQNQNLHQQYKTNMGPPDQKMNLPYLQRGGNRSKSTLFSNLEKALNNNTDLA